MTIFIHVWTIPWTWVLYALCASMCPCPKPVWQHLPLFVPQCRGQIDFDSVRGQTDTQTPPSPPSTLTSLSSFISQQSIPLHSTLRGRGSRSTLPSLSFPYFIQVGSSLMEPECWIFHVDLPHHTFLSWGCWTFFKKHVKLSICISCLSFMHVHVSNV